MTARRMSLPSGFCAKASAWPCDSKPCGRPIPFGAIRPVIRIKAGPNSAESMPPAPNKSQKMGEMLRFRAMLRFV